MRLFIGIDLPLEMKEEIIFLQDKLSALSWKGKTTEPENLHLTLKFLGDVSEKKMIKVKSVLNKVHTAPLKIRMENLGVFKRNGIPGIVWVKIIGLDRLQRRIDDVLKFNFDKEEKFMPHITLARIKNVNNPTEFNKAISSLKVKPLQAPLTEFKLFMSDLSHSKPEYVVLKTYTLK